MQKGSIGVTSENIFPVIKKFLYSDHEIFLRELVSNAVDATQKLKTMSSKGDINEDLGDLTIHIKLDKNTITISDHGIGMTAEEIDKYINQIAFSGANDFLTKYKNDANAIIGHFGLGFYSAFMVSKKVEIITKSYKADSAAVKWTCEGNPEFEIENVDKKERGTDVVLYIDEDCKEFLEEDKITQLLKKYCHFLPIPIAFGKMKEWKEGKQIETDKDNIINITKPLWTCAPTELKEEDYKKFYNDLYPYSDEPLFWIHLNVDFPFNLTGILYFPKVKSNIELVKNKIQLYANQVYVTDSIEDIVPDFLTLLHGVLDSPDIPLNVSRSYLQSDSNVKKISSYITKKVSDRLLEIFKADRSQYEQKWNDLKIFIHYGMLTQEDFYNRAKDFALFVDTEGKKFTYEEYKVLVKDNQTDMDGNLVYLYSNNKEEQFSYIESAKNKGYNVLLMDGQLDIALVSLLEQKSEKLKFMRVDSDIIDNIIVKDTNKPTQKESKDQELIISIFKSQLPKLEKIEFNIMPMTLGENASPILITRNEYMRRMKEMSNIQAGMSFYGDMPDMYNLIVNSDHEIIKHILVETNHSCSGEVEPLKTEISKVEHLLSNIRVKNKDVKEENISQPDKDQISDLENQLKELKSKMDKIYHDFASKYNPVSQLIDLALLQNGMLKGEPLTKFVTRCFELIK